MKHLQNFKLFQESDYDWARDAEGKEYVDLPNHYKDYLNNRVKGSWTMNPKTKLIDVDGDFDCSFEMRAAMESGIQFGKISGNFSAYGNRFEDFTGFPKFVKKEFDVGDNPIKNYEGAPFSVGRRFKSDLIDKRGREWNAKEILHESTTALGLLKDALLTSPFLNADCWNKLFEIYPGEGVALIGPVWEDPDFAHIRDKVKLPPGFEDELNLISGFSDLGIF